MTSIRLALLDDYPDVGRNYLCNIPGVDVTSFPDTIVPQDASGLDALVERLEPFPIISCMRERTPFRAELLSRLPNLKLLATTGLRNLGIDVAAAKSRGIIVAGTSGNRELSTAKYPKVPEIPKDYDATTQQTFSLLLSLTSRIPIDNHAIREKGAWQTGLGISLGNRIFGCVGLGRLGAKAARTATLGFGMKVVAWSTNLYQDKADEAAARMGLAKGSIRAVSKEELLSTADVVSIHYLLSDRSRGLIGLEELQTMKPSALLINTSRGPIVSEEALLDVLERGQIRGAGLDVFDVEPLPSGNRWRTTQWGEDGRSDVVLSGHMGYGTEEVIHRYYAEQADTVERWMQGEPLPDLLS